MPKTISPEIQKSITLAVDWLWEKYGQSSFDTSNDFQVEVYQLLDKLFDLSELRDLSFKLSIDFDNLNGQNKRDKAREIVSYCQRHNLIPEFRVILSELRPKITWPKADKPSLTEKSYEAKWSGGIEKYYKRLFGQVGFVRILGRMESEPLENVFTHVNVLDKLTAEQRYDVAKLKAEFDPRDFGRLERVCRVAGDDAVAEFPKLFVLGKPGAGKTTFLKHTALRAIRHEIKKVPLFVTLKELSDSGKELVEFMTHQLSVHRFPEPEVFLTRLLENGDALVLFDGLDEVNLEDDNRAKMIQQINDFVYRYSDCATLMTCRVAATDYSFTQFEYVEMADFDARQMANYIDLWFVGDDVKRENFKKALLEDENYKPVRELAQVPLLLALLCLVYEERNEIPPERSEIYEEAMRALLSKWDSSRNIRRDEVYQQLSLGRKQKMLAIIAAKTFEQGRYFLKEREVVRLIQEYLQGVPGLDEPDAERVLQSMEAQHGIFVERAKGIYSFSHLTLQEYFTARYISDNERQGTIERLISHADDNRWNEVFLLVAAMLDNATEFTELILISAEQMLKNDKYLYELLNWSQERNIVSKRMLSNVAIRAFSQYMGFATAFFSSDSAIDLPLLVRFDLALSLLYEGKKESNLELIYNFPKPRKSTLTSNDLLVRRVTLDSIGLMIRAVANARALAFSLIISVSQGLKASITIYSHETAFRDGIARFHLLAMELADLYDLADMCDELEKLSLPVESEAADDWEDFLIKTVIILKKYQTQWDCFETLEILEHEVEKWGNLTADQLKNWTSYNSVNLLLVRCLQVAYVPNRKALEDKILLPPEMW